MARQATGCKVYKRERALWVWWPDGKGGKVRQRLVDEKGEKLQVGSPARIINQSAARMYDAWCRVVEEPAREEMTILGLTDSYSRAHSAGWKKTSIKNYSLWMRNLEEFLGQPKLLKDISAKRAEELKQWLLSRPIGDGKTLSTRSVKDRMELYERMWEWAIRMDFVERNPFRKITRVVSTPTRERQPFNPEEVGRLLRAAQDEMPWFLPPILVISLTGSRRGPIPFMEVRDFDPAKGILIARDEISKHDRGQVYHLPKHVTEVLTRLTAGRGPKEPLFLNEAGRPLSIKVFDRPNPTTRKLPPRARAWFRLQAIAQVQPRGVHNLRRAAVSNLAAADVTMEKITSVTGQTPEVAREHYLTLNSSAQRETMEKLAELYGGAAPVDAVDSSGSEIVLRLAPQEAASLAALLTAMTDADTSSSGTKSGTKPEPEGESAVISAMKVKMAEREGFEPSIQVTPYDDLANRCLQPLGHLSAATNRKGTRHGRPRSSRFARLHR